MVQRKSIVSIPLRCRAFHNNRIYTTNMSGRATATATATATAPTATAPTVTAPTATATALNLVQPALAPQQ